MFQRSALLLLNSIKESFATAKRETFINTGLMAFSVTLAVLIAELSHRSAPYWAGISAIMIVLPTLAEIVKKGLMRLMGTFIGAACGVGIHYLTAHSHLLFFCFLFLSIAVPLLVLQKSRFPYAWFIGGVTCDIVMLGSFLPGGDAFAIGLERSFEISIGVVTAMTVYILATLAGRTTYVVAETRLPQEPPPSFPWVGIPLPAAVAGGIASCIAAGLWLLFGFHGIEQSITTIWVLSFGALTSNIWHKAFQRAGGCFAGGAIGALLLLLPPSFMVFLILIFVVSAIFSIIQNGPIDGRYFGLQGIFAFLIVYASTEGPLPAIDRFFSILLGLAVLLIISWLILQLLNYLGRVKTPPN